MFYLVGVLVPVRWAEIAAATGRIAHRQMQFPHITSYNSQKQNSSPVDIWDEGINEGHLPKHLARSLWRILKGRTITSERCWFAVWEGWGSFGVLEADIFAAPAFEIPGRRLHLFSARIEAAERSFSVDDPFFGQLANLWWPDDRAWCVVTEIDFNTTYVGGSQKAIAALVQSAELEADIIEPSDGVQWASDTLNPLPKDS